MSTKRCDWRTIDSTTKVEDARQIVKRLRKRHPEMRFRITTLAFVAFGYRIQYAEER